MTRASSSSDVRPAATFARLFASASSSPCDAASTATGSSGSGMSHGAIRSGSSRAEIVSPVSAVMRATAQTSPATACGTAWSVDPKGR